MHLIHHLSSIGGYNSIGGLSHFQGISASTLLEAVFYCTLGEMLKTFVINVQAFVVSTSQGALFAQVTQSGGQADWKILKKGWGDSWKVIGRMQRRPTPQDLEAAFYNASAAESPLTAGIKAIRQLVPSKKE